MSGLFEKFLAWLLTLRCSAPSVTDIIASVTLRDGRVCTLRYLGPRDAKIFHSHMLKVSYETNFNACDSAGLVNPKRTVGEDAVRLARALFDPDTAIIGAFLGEDSGEKLVGVAQFSGQRVGPNDSDSDAARVATFGVSILRDFWGLGIGSALLGLAIDLARDYGFDALELEVMTENKRAIALYKKFGFVPVTHAAQEHVKIMRLAL